MIHRRAGIDRASAPEQLLCAKVNLVCRRKNYKLNSEGLHPAIEHPQIRPASPSPICTTIKTQQNQDSPLLVIYKKTLIWNILFFFFF